MSNPFDYLNDINTKGNNRIRDSDAPEMAEKLYNKFLTNRMLSYHDDAIQFVNLINICGTAQHGVTGKQHYEYLLHSVPKRKRFAKMVKPEIEDNISLIQKTYKYSYEKARSVFDLFSDADFEMMRQSQTTGGVDRTKK